MNQTNYIQIGRMQECSKCHPEKGYADYHKEVKCECICHDINNRIREEWKEWAFTNKQHLGRMCDRKEIEDYWISKIDELLKSQRAELVEKIEKELEKESKYGDTERYNAFEYILELLSNLSPNKENKNNE